MKKKTVLKDLRAKESKLAAELADVRKQIRAEEARQASVQGTGLGEMMRKRYAELHPDANLDDLTPEEMFQLVLADQAAKPVASEENEAGDLASTNPEVEMLEASERESGDELEQTEQPEQEPDGDCEHGEQEAAADCERSEQQMFRF